MDNSTGLVVDLYGVPFSPTIEELEKAEECKEKLNELLEGNQLSSQRVREALTEYARDQDLCLIFVRGRKLNVTRAVESMKRMAEIRYDKYPEMFPVQVPDSVRHVWDHHILDCLRRRDHLGRLVVPVNIEKWDPSVVSLDDIILAARYLIESGLNAPEVLVSGFVVLYDFRGVTFRHARQFSLSSLLKSFNLFCIAYPFPLKGIYVVNAPFFARSLYALAKPFLPLKLQERVLITSGVDEVHKRISPTILPDYLGGKLSHNEAVISDCFQRITQQLCHFNL